MQTPNVIMITSDQQRTDSLRCYGAPFACTPGTDRLAAEGVLLERAYCANPVCTPSRTSIFSGQQVSRHGAWNVGVHTNPNLTMLSHRLTREGYRSHYVGKMHFQPFGSSDSQEGTKNWEERFPEFSGPYYGFETVELALGHTGHGMTAHYGNWVRAQVGAERFSTLTHGKLRGKHRFSAAAMDWDLPVALHNSVWTADRTISWLTEYKQTNNPKPFLLGVGFQDPHHPHMLPLDYADRIDPAVVPAPDYTPGELADKPPHFQLAHLGKLEQSPYRGAYQVAGQARSEDASLVPAEDARLGRAYYYSMCQLLDQQLLRILTCLDELGYAENTIVIFTTDHGELLGDHGIWLKGPFHYEQLVRVPMLVRWPNGLPAGKRVKGLFSHVDIVPTVLSASGFNIENHSIEKDVDGVNALSLLRGESQSVRDDVLVECVDDPNRLRLKTVVTQNRKLTWYAGQPFGELYDLTHDPTEKVNLWDDSAYATEKAELLGRILDYMENIEGRPERVSYA